MIETFDSLMFDQTSKTELASTLRFTRGPIYGVGEMAEQIRAYPWENTAVGPIESWPNELIFAVNQMLYSPLPGSIFWGPDFISFYNDAFLPALSGKHPGSLGQPAREVWKEAWSAIGDQLDSVLKGTVLSFERVPYDLLVNGAPQKMYWDYAYTPIRSSTGAILGVFDVARDVTSTAIAEAKLKEAEAQANRVLGSIGDAVVVTNADGEVTRMNQVAEDLTQWTIAEAQGMPLAKIFRIVNEDTRKIAEDPAEKVRQFGFIVGLANHTILIGKDGRETHIDDSAAPIRDDSGTLTGVVLVFRDVEERRTAERQRDLLAARLSGIQDATTDSILSIDRDWNVTYLNGPAQAIAGPLANAIGRNFWEQFPDTVYEGSPYVKHYYRAMDEGIGGEFEAFYPPPLDIWVEVRVRPMQDGIVLFFRNITESKRSTAALVQAEKLAAVGKLAASIAHEINNPLESVTNLLYLARSSESLAEIQDYLDTAERELRRVSVISNQTLRFYKQSTDPTEVTCEDLFESVSSVYHGRLVNSRITVEKRNRANRVVRCFDGEVRQVLNNLVGNAIDAMHPQGGRLLLRSREGRNQKTGQPGIVLTVADTGSGMPSQVLRKVFEAFYTTKGIGGTGLGLWVSKQIMDRHHGTLLARSSQKKGQRGTVFALFLPFDAVGR